MHPILALPSEILSEIFVQCLPPYPICAPLLGGRSPTTLAQVCRSWRETAHATPELWRGIALFTSERLWRFPKLQIFTAKTWIERSGALPLCVIFDSATHPIHDEDRAEGLSLLLDESARWEYAALFCSTSEWIPGQVLDCDMPMLRQLDVTYEDLRPRPLEDIDTLDAPRLTTALLDCNFLPDETTACINLLAWSQLTRVFLANIEFDPAVGALQHATNLVDCRLDFDQWAWSPHDESIPQPGQVFVFPWLETLIITAAVSDYNHFDELLLATRAPNLRRLHLDQNMLDEDSDSLQLVLDSLGCQLERLLLSLAHVRRPLEIVRNSLLRVGMIEVNPSEHLPPDIWGHWDLRRL
uniref:F-box domain-containing protein n=1 Tax=Mycena chlorophos TaxID=658473 RepID=A0ABQ0KXB2_MYCCL|nr:predicted protein [Mycena chlorophos]